MCTQVAPNVSITSAYGKPKLSWNAVNGADKYWVYRSTDGVNFKYYDTTTKTTYTNKSVTAGTTYYYKVKAVKVVNGSSIASQLSNSVSVKAKLKKKREPTGFLLIIWGIGKCQSPTMGILSAA